MEELSWAILCVLGCGYLAVRLYTVIRYVAGSEQEEMGYWPWPKWPNL